MHAHADNEPTVWNDPSLSHTAFSPQFHSAPCIIGPSGYKASVWGSWQREWHALELSACLEGIAHPLNTKENSIMYYCCFGLPLPTLDNVDKICCNYKAVQLAD